MKLKINSEKDKFMLVPDEFRDSLNSMTELEIRARIAQVALDQAELMELKKEDQDLSEKKEQAKMAGEMYAEGSKINRLKIEYAKSVLDAKGK